MEGERQVLTLTQHVHTAGTALIEWTASMIPLTLMRDVAASNVCFHFIRRLSFIVAITRGICRRNSLTLD